MIERFEELSAEPERRPEEEGAAEAAADAVIAAAIYCERDGQKAILIGKGGSKLKEIPGTGRGSRSSRCLERGCISSCM